MTQLLTLTMNKPFTYHRHLAHSLGIKIEAGRTISRNLSKEDIDKILYHFIGKTVPVGASITLPRPSNSLGQFLMDNVSKQAIASYLAPILIHEGYAERIDSEIRFVRLPFLTKTPVQLQLITFQMERVA